MYNGCSLAQSLPQESDPEGADPDLGVGLLPPSPPEKENPWIGELSEISHQHGGHLCIPRSPMTVWGYQIDWQLLLCASHNSVFCTACRWMGEWCNLTKNYGGYLAFYRHSNCHCWVALLLINRANFQINGSTQPKKKKIRSNNKIKIKIKWHCQNVLS